MESAEFHCDICKRDGRFETDWLHHVASLSHQRVLSRLPGGGKGHWDTSVTHRSRAVTVQGCNTVKATPLELANYLTKFGKLEEFICPTSIQGTKPDQVHCLFVNEESIDKILQVEDHQIFRQKIKVMKKYSTNSTTTIEKCSSDDETHSSNTAEVKENSEDGLLENGNGSNNNGDSLDLENGESWAKGLKLEQQLPKLFVQISIPAEQNRKRVDISKEVQEIIRNTFSNCTVFSYGTDSLGIGMKQDAVRLCVDPYGTLGNKTHGVIEPKSATDQMSSNLIFQILSTHQHNNSSLFKFVSLYSISPMVQFTIPEISFKLREIPCKLRFENFLTLQKSRLVKFLSKHDVRVWPLLMLLRRWSHDQEIFNTLHEGQDLESYEIILLLIFYLTKEKIIPSVTYLQGLSNSPLVINQINVSFCSDSKICPPAKVKFMDDEGIRTLSTLSLLKEFFEYFSKLDYKEYVICTALGQLIPRKNFRQQMERELPEEIKEKYRYASNGDLRVPKLNIFSPLCLQDPLDLTENVTIGVDEVDLCEFQGKCRQGAKAVENILTDSNPNLLDLFASRKTDDPSEETELKREREEDELAEDQPPTTKLRI